MLLLIAPSAGSAHSSERTPISEEFGPLELTLTAVTFVAGPVVLLGGPSVVTKQPLELRPPPPGTLDYAVSKRFHGDLDTGARVAGGFLDPMLLATPWAALVFYGASSLRAAVAPAWLGQHDIAHSTLAYAQALGWTSLLVGTARLAVGRERPWVALDREQFARDGIDPRTSLASSHTALGATFASFVALDLSTRLRYHDGAGWFVGRALPYAALFGFVGAASVAHLADQENFLTDELLGLAIGIASGTLAWLRHFDSHGRPRARRSESASHTVFVTPFASADAAGLTLLIRRGR